MPTEIAGQNPGRALPTYDLMDEIADATGMSRREAHNSIHALLEQIVDIDGEASVILNQRPQRPELLHANPHDLDVNWWLTISDDAAQTIRDSLAAHG